jgi:hypothetical protein
VGLPNEERLQRGVITQFIRSTFCGSCGGFSIIGGPICVIRGIRALADLMIEAWAGHTHGSGQCTSFREFLPALAVRRVRLPTCSSASIFVWHFVRRNAPERSWRTKRRYDRQPDAPAPPAEPTALAELQNVIAHRPVVAAGLPMPVKRKP